MKEHLPSIRRVLGSVPSSVLHMAHTYCSFGSFLSYHNSACGEKSCRRHYRDQSTGHIICVISSCAKMINTQNAIKLNSPFICMMSGKGYLISILSTHAKEPSVEPGGGGDARL